MKTTMPIVIPDPTGAGVDLGKVQFSIQYHGTLPMQHVSFSKYYFSILSWSHIACSISCAAALALQSRGKGGCGSIFHSYEMYTSQRITITCRYVLNLHSCFEGSGIMEDEIEANAPGNS